MGRHKLFFQDAKVVRDHLNAASALASIIHDKEASLIKRLGYIDSRQFYVRYGYKSLMGFCRYGLRFSKTQALRIVNKVRRSEPTANITAEGSLESIKPLSQFDMSMRRTPPD